MRSQSTDGRYYERVHLRSSSTLLPTILEQLLVRAPVTICLVIGAPWTLNGVFGLYVLLKMAHSTRCFVVLLRSTLHCRADHCSRQQSPGSRIAWLLSLLLRLRLARHMCEFVFSTLHIPHQQTYDRSHRARTTLRRSRQPSPSGEQQDSS